MRTQDYYIGQERPAGRVHLRRLEACLSDKEISVKEFARRIIAVLLCALLVTASQDDLIAQQPEGAPAYSSADPSQPLTPDQLDQLVAPIALYPDALTAQILAASTYPTQIVDADRWLQTQAGASSQTIASAANSQTWDPSVKALTAFPSVLAQLDKNLDWTTNLGNAYYNQPQDVMGAIQSMRQRAQSAGNLESTSQQTVSTVNGSVVIAPGTTNVVYVPAYNPWLVYGSPIVAYPGFFYAPLPGIVFGAGLAIGFGIGIRIGAFAGWEWGWSNWRLGWRSRIVVFNHATYVTRSRTVINRGFNRPGGPPPGAGARGAFARANHFNQGGDRGFHQAQAQHANAGFRRGGFGSEHSFSGRVGDEHEARSPHGSGHR
jgi:hypothetical protein